MTFRLDDAWVWDCWFVEDGDQVHMFYLQAPRALGDPDLRHRNARIGHAVSTDLVDWQVLPNPLAESPRHSYDRDATWTGSIARSADGVWQLLYTGCEFTATGHIQRILRATSTDLVNFERVAGVVIEADQRWYERAGDPGAGPETHWRDPWLFWDEPTTAWHLLITARANHGPSDGRGVIGHASSIDLREWTVHPPLTEPGEFRQLEVPQLLEVGPTPRILFSANESDQSAARFARIGKGAGGSHFLIADTRFGTYRLDGDTFFAPDHQLHIYAGRLVRHSDQWWLLGWETGGPDGSFDGVIADPVKVTLDGNGTPQIAP